MKLRIQTTNKQVLERRQFTKNQYGPDFSLTVDCGTEARTISPSLVIRVQFLNHVNRILRLIVTVGSR